MGQEITWLQGHCLPYGGEPPYGPFVEMLRSWLDISPGEPEISVRTKLRARLLALSPASAPRLIAFLSRLLSLKLTAEIEAKIRDLEPEELAREIRDSYVAWVEALTDQAPVVLALEDLHFADATTCLLAEQLASLTDAAPLCLAATMEAKGSTEGWKLRMRFLTDYPHRVTEVAVAPLPDGASAQLVDMLTPAGRLEPWLTSEIVGRAEGNPFFLKELLRSVIEGGSSARDNTWTISADLPPALESLLVARIDRLPHEVRRVAQIAAVLGLEFSFHLLEKATRSEGLRQSLATLLRAEVIRELRRYPALDYTFTSSLLHEAVLSSLTPARLKALHGRVGLLLEQETPLLAEENPALLAFYFYRSDHQEKALSYLELAAARASSLDATPQAKDLLRRALKPARKLGDGDSIRRIEAALAESQ
jgi:predicted ATPase